MANKFEKTFIGKGKKIAGMDIVRVTIALNALEEIAYDYEGTAYCTFEIAKLKETDKWGRTHSCYYSKMLEPAIPEPNAPRKKKAAPATLEPQPF